MKYTDDGSGLYCEKVNGKFLCVPFSAMKKDGFVKERACPLDKCNQIRQGGKDANKLG